MKRVVTDTARGVTSGDSLQETRLALRESSFLANLRFDDLGGCKLSVSMRLGARVACMQFTDFPDRCTTSGTRYR